MSDELGLNVDMLDVDRLRDWARLIDEYGPDISQWGSAQFVAGKLRDIAARLEQEVREVGVLRSQIGRGSVPASGTCNLMDEPCAENERFT